MASGIDMLRRGLTSLHGITGDDENSDKDKQKLTVFYCDHILSMVEQNNFYKPQFDYFCKLRFLPFFGLAAGQRISAEEILGEDRYFKARSEIISYKTIQSYSYADNVEKLEKTKLD